MCSRPQTVLYGLPRGVRLAGQKEPAGREDGAGGPSGWKQKRPTCCAAPRPPVQLPEGHARPVPRKRARRQTGPAGVKEVPG
jgi:hypothetical protein